MEKHVKSNVGSKKNKLHTLRKTEVLHLVVENQYQQQWYCSENKDWSGI